MHGSEDEFIAKWSESGLLDNLSEDIDEIKSDLAMSLELICDLLVKEATYSMDIDKYSTLIIPIATKVFRACPELMNYDQVRNLYVHILLEVKNSYHTIEDLNAAPGIDPESELCLLIAEKFIKMHTDAR